MGCFAEKESQGEKNQQNTNLSEWNYKQEGRDWGYNSSQQSPINVIRTSVRETTDVKITVNYGKPIYDFILHPEHHYKLEGAFGTLSLWNKGDKRVYTAAQFHFHSPSEHQIDGKFGDLEVHIVHSNKEFPDFQNAVLGFIFKIGNNKNVFLDKVLNGQAVNLDDLISQAQTTQSQQGVQISEVFHYKGSLTTPPCTENVNWLLYSKTLEAHKDQIKFFKRMWEDNKHFAGGKGSNRVVQDVGKREVLLLKA